MVEKWDKNDMNPVGMIFWFLLSPLQFFSLNAFIATIVSPLTGLIPVTATPDALVVGMRSSLLESLEKIGSAELA